MWDISRVFANVLDFWDSFFETFFVATIAIPNHGKVHIFRKLNDQRLWKMSFCTLELYYNLTPAD